MKPFIFGERNGIYILDLQADHPRRRTRLTPSSRNVAKGGNVLFVGTKKQAQESVRDERC